MSDSEREQEEPESAQGAVTIYHFPGISGILGWGWLHPRFLVFEHAILLVYGSEEDWQEHREPLDDVALSRDSTVELRHEDGEILVQLRGPGHATLTFSGSSVDGGDGTTSEEWTRILNNEIGRLRREADSQQSAIARQPGSLSVWNPFSARSGASGARRGAGGSVGGSAGGIQLVEVEGAFESLEDDEEMSEIAEHDDDADGGGNEGDGNDEEEEKESGDGQPGESALAVAASTARGIASVDGAKRRGSESGARLRRRTPRWALHRGGSTRHLSDLGYRTTAFKTSKSDGLTASVSGRVERRQDGDVEAARLEDGTSAAHPSGTREAGIGIGTLGRPGSNYSGDGGTTESGWGRAAAKFWRKRGMLFRRRSHGECACKWCHDDLGGSSLQTQNDSGKRRNNSIYGRRCASWGSRENPPARQVSANVSRWEYMVGRWVPLQHARAGDEVCIKRFLERYPNFPDKDNLLRAAVRYKHYSLVKYFLEEQDMDVNLVNSAGMPLVWFSVVFMQKGDSGVMLRYLQQKGADITMKNSAGQTVLFLLVSSRGKEAIPTLQYLVEEHGLSLVERDMFGSQPLHWAVLYGHLDTVQWISRRTMYGGARADWLGAFQKMARVRLIRPEHAGAVRSWRMRGLQKSARSLTPLGVAVLHNHEEIAKWLMGHGTDSSTCIQMKRGHLFNENNRDLHLVAKTWPELLPGVLNGFEKKDTKRYSWDTEDRHPTAPTGWSERTYQIKQLYGLPEVPTNRSPLSILLSTEHPRLFEIKVVQMIVALKWSVFGQRYYLWELSRYLALSTFFILGFIVWGDTTNWVGPIPVGEDTATIVGGTLARVACWCLTLYNLIVEEGREFKAAKSTRKYLMQGWNVMSLIAYTLVLALIPVHKPWVGEVKWAVDAHGYTVTALVRRILTAPAALLLFTRFMEHLAVWRSTGVFIAVIRMIVIDTLGWAVLFILFELSFSLAFYALLRGNPGFETVGYSIVTTFLMTAGDVTVPFSDSLQLHIVGVLLFITFTLLVAILYLNLLVAMMTAGYDKVVKLATAQATMNRAAALVKWEGIMSHNTRVKSFRRVSPGRGKRAHISLRGWFGGGVTQVFVDEEGATAVEPEQSSKMRVDSQSVVLTQLGEIRAMVEHLAKRSLPRRPPAEDSFSSSDQDTSFRQRQAGMLDSEGNVLSDLKLRVHRRQGPGGSVSSEEVKEIGGAVELAEPVDTERVAEWKEKARKVEQRASSRRGIIRAQALIRGHLHRSGQDRALFLPDNKD